MGKLEGTFLIKTSSFIFYMFMHYAKMQIDVQSAKMQSCFNRNMPCGQLFSRRY